MNLFSSLFQRIPPPDPHAIAEMAAERAVAAVRAEQEATRVQVAQRVAEVQELARAQGLVGMPGQVPARAPRLFARDHPWDWATYQGSNYRPRQIVSVEMMRQFSQRYDPLRSMINYIKDHVKTIPLIISPRDKDDDTAATRKRIREMEDWFELEGGLGGANCLRHEFEGQVIEDWHVVGPCAIYLEPTRGGLSRAIAIDAATIKPRVDLYGWPGPGENWYEQYVDGILQRGFTPEELYWHGFYPRTDSPYPDSPCEYLVLTVLAAMSADTWNRTWLTDGTMPGEIIYLPPDMPPEVAQIYIDMFDARLRGDISARQRALFMPGGTGGPPNPTRRDQDFELFSENLMRRCSAIIGVQLSAIGFPQGQYATTQAASVDQTEEVGVGKVIFHLQVAYNYFLRRNGYGDLIATFRTEKEEDALSRAERLLKATGVPWMTPNEARKEDGQKDSLGEEGDTLFTPTAFQPVDLALNPPEPALPGTAAGTESSGDRQAQQQRADLKRWERKALRRLKDHGAPFCRFQSEVLPEETLGYVEAALQLNTTAENVRGTFAQALDDLFPPVYHTSAQAWERQQIAAKWRERRLRAEREA